MRQILICEKVTESIGFEIGFKIRHIPSLASKIRDSDNTVCKHSIKQL